MLTIDAEKFKTSLVKALEKGHIDNLQYIEWLDWIRQLEKEKT